MSLTNPRSILRQIRLLFDSLHNLRLMIFRHNQLFYLAFSIAALSTLLNSTLYMAIAILSCLCLILLANSSWASEGCGYAGGLKSSLILASLILMCLLLPQVDTNTANFSSPTDRLENRTRLS